MGVYWKILVLARWVHTIGVIICFRELYTF